MITNKDIRVENGSLIINGDKYPLDGQSPEAIMEIVEDNSDTTPTENSTAPVTSGGVYTALGTKQDTLTFDDAPTASSNNPVKSDGIKTYVDNAVSELYVNIGTVSADSDYEAMGLAWDALTIYDKPVLVRYQFGGVQMALMLKYVGGQFGMAMGMKYGQTKINIMGVNNGTKSYATTATT